MAPSFSSSSASFILAPLTVTCVTFDVPPALFPPYTLNASPLSKLTFVLSTTPLALLPPKIDAVESAPFKLTVVEPVTVAELITPALLHPP